MYGTNIIRMMKELTDGMADVRQQMREGGEEEREIEGRIVDVEYREIISNPMGVVEVFFFLLQTIKSSSYLKSNLPSIETL